MIQARRGWISDLAPSCYDLVSTDYPCDHLGLKGQDSLKFYEARLSIKD
jgi:hypothetical protein